MTKYVKTKIQAPLCTKYKVLELQLKAIQARARRRRLRQQEGDKAKKE